MLLGLLDVDSRDAAAALLQGRIVSGGLGAKQAAEAERLAGNRDLLAGIVDDLEEEAGVRAALVQLPGRVEVARPVAVGDDEPAAAAELADEVVDPAVVLARSAR